MKRKIFSMLIAASLLLSPFAVFGAGITAPESAADLLYEQDFSDPNFSITYHTWYNSGKRVELDGEGCWSVFAYGSSPTVSYPAPFKVLDKAITEGFVVFKGSFLIPQTVLEGDKTGNGKPQFSIHWTDPGSWNDATTFAVQFDAENDKVNYHWKNPGSLFASKSASVSYDKWHDVIIVLDLSNDKAYTYLDETLVLNGVEISPDKGAGLFSAESGYGSAVGAISYVDNLEVFTASDFKPYKKVSLTNKEILGYYAYDDFEGYKYIEGVDGLTNLDGTAPSDTNDYDMRDYMQMENGNKYLKGVGTYFMGRTFTLYSPLKSGYAHLHADLKIPSGVRAYLGLGKQIADTNYRQGDVAGVFFAENAISLSKPFTSNKFDEVASVGYFPTAFSANEWHDVDIFYNFTNKTFDIFVDGTPRFVDLYFCAAQSEEPTKDNPITAFEYKTAVVGMVEPTTEGFCVDNIYVADVSGNYIADMFKEGYTKLIDNNTVTAGESRYVKNGFVLPFSANAIGEDAGISYSTTNDALSLGKTAYSLLDEIKIEIKEDAVPGTKGNFTVSINKAGEQTAVTVPMYLLPEMAASAANPVLNVSAFTVDGSITANGEVTAKGLIENTSESDETVQVLLAVYYGTQLKAVKVESLTAKARKINELKTESLTLPENLPTGCTAKAFVWNLGALKAIVPVK